MPSNASVDAILSPVPSKSTRKYRVTKVVVNYGNILILIFLPEELPGLIGHDLAAAGPAEHDPMTHARSALLVRARKLLARDQALIDARARDELERILAEHPSLASIYQMRLELQAVWQQRTRSAQEILAALRGWCERAEQSGNERLSEFAAYLRSYTLANA